MDEVSLEKQKDLPFTHAIIPRDYLRNMAGANDTFTTASLQYSDPYYSIATLVQIVTKLIFCWLDTESKSNASQSILYDPDYCNRRSPAALDKMEGSSGSWCLQPQ